MRIYLSGKITNNIEYKLQFQKAENQLRLLGFDVLNPTRMCIYDWFTYQDCIKLDLALLEMCDAIYMLDGWQDSKGANYELATAKVLGKKTMYEACRKPKSRSTGHKQDGTIAEMVDASTEEIIVKGDMCL